MCLESDRLVARSRVTDLCHVVITPIDDAPSGEKLPALHPGDLKEKISRPVAASNSFKEPNHPPMRMRLLSGENAATKTGLCPAPGMVYCRLPVRASQTLAVPSKDAVAMS